MAAPVELEMDDREVFRQMVTTFITKQQTWFHREESLIIARPKWGIKWPHPLIGVFPTGNGDRAHCHL
jgi:hypothetical protein